MFNTDQAVWLSVDDVVTATPSHVISNIPTYKLLNAAYPVKKQQQQQKTPFEETLSKFLFP